MVFLCGKERKTADFRVKMVKIASFMSIYGHKTSIFGSFSLYFSCQNLKQSGGGTRWGTMTRIWGTFASIKYICYEIGSRVHIQDDIWSDNMLTRGSLQSTLGYCSR